MSQRTSSHPSSNVDEEGLGLREGVAAATADGRGGGGSRRGWQEGWGGRPTGAADAADASTGDGQALSLHAAGQGSWGGGGGEGKGLGF